MSSPSLLPEVEGHFRTLTQNPSEAIDADLLDKFELQLTENIDSFIVQSLIPQIAQVILTIHHEASPLAKLGTKIVTISKLKFSDFASLDSNLDLNAGLNIPSIQINLLVIAIIGKGADSTSEAALVAGKPELVLSLVNLWLRSEDTLLSSKASEVLVSLLRTDQEGHHPQGNAAEGASGSGLMWRRIFSSDRDIYDTIFSICSLSNAGQVGQLKARDKSIAQGRLMDFLKQVAEMDWSAITDSHFTDIESKYGVRDGGLLDFAASQMVDITDPLAYLTLMSFFTDLINIPLEIPPHSPAAASAALNFSSPALDFLISRKLHQKVISYYLAPTSHNQFDLRFLSGPSAQYLVTYLSNYPKHLLTRSTSSISDILERIRRAFNISTNTWGQPEYPGNSLNVLASLPRVLLTQDSSPSNPLLMLPTKPPNADIFRTLATLFHGPKASEVKFPPTSVTPSQEDPTSPSGEAASARVLYFLYSHNHPELWPNVIAAADSVALADTALAAIALIEAVMTADWLPLPEPPSTTRPRYSLPTEDQLQRLGLPQTDKNAVSGVWALLQAPALPTVVTYLFQEPKMFSKGSGIADEGSSTYDVAVAKYEVLVKFQDRLRGLGVREFDDMRKTVERRVVQGPWPRGVRPGERVEALDM